MCVWVTSSAYDFVGGATGLDWIWGFFLENRAATAAAAVAVKVVVAVVVVGYLHN